MMDLKRLLAGTEEVMKNRLYYLCNSLEDPYNIQHAPSRAYTVSEHTEAFLERNRQYWDLFFEGVDVNKQKKIIVDATPDRLEPLVIHCTIGMFLAKTLDIEPLFIVIDDYKKKRIVCESFYPGKFVPIGKSTHTNRSLLNAGADLACYYKILNNPNEFQDLSVNGVPIGDIVYSTAIRKSGEGTFNEVNRTLYRYLAQALVHFYNYQPIFERYDIDAVLANHPLFVNRGLLARVGISNGADFYTPDLYRFEKFCSLDRIGNKPGRPTRSLFNYILSNRQNKAIERADAILEERMGVKPGEITNRPDCGTSASAQESDSKTVLVMPHIFIEHLRGKDRMLFQDYLTWLRAVLRFAVDHSQVNWLIKPHPHREQYDMKQTVRSEVRNVTDGREDHTISIASEETSAETLIIRSDVILTIDGTAGIEYSCYGIPVVLAGKSPYSGFGYTHEPENKAEYFEYLSEIDQIEPLTENQIQRAKVVCYAYFDLVRDSWPSYNNIDHELSEGERATKFLEKIKSEEDRLLDDLSLFINEDRRHLYQLPEDNV